MHGTTLSTTTIDGRAGLFRIVEDWRALAKAAGEPNPFMEPMAALPALDYPGAEHVFAVVAWGADANGRRRLDGMLLLKRWRRSRLLPRAVQSWNYRLRAYGEPLIRAGRERAFWAAMLPHLDALGGFSVLRLAQLREDSPSTVALREVAADLGRPLFTTRRIERAALRGPRSAGAYLAALPTKMLREQRRRRRRLEELGTVRFERLAAEADPASWIDELVSLEATGWKGREGVAAASEPHVEAFVRHVLREAHADGRLDMRRLRLDGRTISMLAHIESGRSAVSFKIAYDEAFARFSPGVLLQMEALERGLALDWVDSCATPGHPMFDSLWTGRRRIVTLMVPMDRPAARAACALEQAARALRREPAGRAAQAQAQAQALEKA
jgi:CelD/BcsL family acetyltransferase involved in cellulose biosynthesis